MTEPSTPEPMVIETKEGGIVTPGGNPPDGSWPEVEKKEAEADGEQ